MAVCVMDEVIVLIVAHWVSWETIQGGTKIRHSREWEILGHSNWFLKDEWRVDCQMIGEIALQVTEGRENQQSVMLLIEVWLLLERATCGEVSSGFSHRSPQILGILKASPGDVISTPL